MKQYIVTEKQILDGVQYALEINISNKDIVNRIMKDVCMEVETVLEDDCDEMTEEMWNAQKQGHWVEAEGSFVTPGGDPVWECSECDKGRHVYGVENSSYGITDGQWVTCPNCGAKMEGTNE